MQDMNSLHPIFNADIIYALKNRVQYIEDFSEFFKYIDSDQNFSWEIMPFEKDWDYNSIIKKILTCKSSDVVILFSNSRKDGFKFTSIPDLIEFLNSTETEFMREPVIIFMDQEQNGAKKQIKISHEHFWGANF